MLQDRIVHDFLGTLYAAPTSPELWPQVLSDLGAVLGLNASAIVHTDLQCKANGIYTSWGVDPDVERLYVAGYGAHDVYRPRFLRVRERHGMLLMGDDLCSFDEVKRTAFGRDIMHRSDIRLWCAISTVHTDTIIENISLYQPWNDDAPGNDKLEMARLLAPHLDNALRIRAKLVQLEGLSRNLQAALDKADTAIILFDHFGRCAMVNQAAKKILDQRDGLTFVGSQIVATKARESVVLHETIRRAVASCRRKEHPSGEAVCISRRKGKPLQVRVAPLPGERVSDGSHFAAIAIIGNPGAGLPVEILQSAYGLSPAESRLALLLLAGRSMTEAADVNNVSRETVRSQLKSVFLKTGTRRQGELISLLGGLPGEMV